MTHSNTSHTLLDAGRYVSASSGDWECCTEGPAQAPTWSSGWLP